MMDIVVEVRGGLVVEVYCERPEVRVFVVDWDEFDCPERRGKVGFEWVGYASLDALPPETRAQYAYAVAEEPENSAMA
jgi:hypothetical protein